MIKLNGKYIYLKVQVERRIKKNRASLMRRFTSIEVKVVLKMWAV